MTVTKKDIADYLGLSRSAVSLALNNSPGSTISEKTRQRIRQAAKELGYRESNVAPKLVYIIYNRGVNDPRYMIDLKSFEEAAGLFHYSVVVMYVRNHPQDHQRLLNLVKSPDVDGLVITGAVDDIIIELVEGTGVPHLFYANIERNDINKISVNYTERVCQATQYLISYGHRKVAFFSGSLNLFIHKEMLEGYRKALREAGIAFDKSLVQVSNDEDGYELCARTEVLELAFTAAYCANTVIQFGVLQRLKDQGIRVPGEVSLIGSGYTELVKASVPQLTTFQVKPSLQNTVVTRLIDRIRRYAADQELNKEQIYITDFEITQGGTVAICRTKGKI